MSRGMWTKCWTSDGSQSFYYNASKNQSVWQPPPDAIIHEAIHLKPCSNDTRTIDSLALYEDSTIQSNKITATVPVTSITTKMTEETISLQERLMVAAQKQQQNAAKRFKGSTATEENNTTVSSAYLQQKSELEAWEGKDKSDDASKWLVR